MPVRTSERADEADGEGRADRIRPILAGVVGVLAVVSILVGGAGVWAMQVAFDSERFERRVDEVLALPEVSDAIGARVVDEIAAAVGVRDAVVELLPESFEPGADLVLAGVRSFVADRVGEAIRREEVRSLVAAAAGRAHAGAVEVVRGGSLVDGLRVVDDEVRLDLLPVVGVALGRLQELGLFAGVDLPDLTRDVGAEQNRAALSAALDRELPPDFGELVVYRSETLERAGTTVELVQRGVAASARIAALALVVGVVAAVAAVVLARHRVRAVVLVGGVLVAEVLLVQLITERAARRVPSLVESLAGQVATAEIVDDLQRSLVRVVGLIVVTVVALLVSLVAVMLRRPAEQASSAPRDPTPVSS